MKNTNKNWLHLFIAIGFVLSFATSCEKVETPITQPDELTVTDVDGNVYKTVTIGTQIWMAENLKVTKYNDGTAIPLVEDQTAWGNLYTAGYCWYENYISAKNLYGGLYNWYVLNTGKLAPAGWHIPTAAEWITMENYLIANGYNYDGTTTGNKIAKALTSTTGWTTTTVAGVPGNTDYPTFRNKSGFNGVPSGYRYSGGSFHGGGSSCFWWRSVSGGAWSKSINYMGVDEVNFNYTNGYGFSVRCIKD